MLSHMLGVLLVHITVTFCTWRHSGMGGTCQATAGFQDSDIFHEDGVQMYFECDFSPFRIQTLTWFHPCSSQRIMVMCTLNLPVDKPPSLDPYQENKLKTTILDPILTKRAWKVISGTNKEIDETNSIFVSTTTNKINTKMAFFSFLG